MAINMLPSNYNIDDIIYQQYAVRKGFSAWSRCIICR
jgi:hypothetical protein